MKLSTWRTRPFLNPLTAESLGDVSGFYVNTAGKVRYLYADGKAYSVKKLIAEKDAVLTVNDAETPERCILIHRDAKIYDTYGNAKGVLEDWDSESDIHLSSTGEPLVRIVAGSKDYLIINPDKRVLKRRTTSSAAPKPKTVTPKITPIPFAQNIRIEERETKASAPLIQEPTVETKPVDYSFLIGRRLDRDVTDLTRTFFLPAGTVITPTIINLAKRAGKIVDLAAGSLIPSSR